MRIDYTVADVPVTSKVAGQGSNTTMGARNGRASRWICREVREQAPSATFRRFLENKTYASAGQFAGALRM
jgi:hypothetical protein